MTPHETIESKKAPKRRSRRRVARAAAVATVSALAFAGAASAADASTVTPFETTKCNGQICMYVSGSGLYVPYVEVWNQTRSFRGHFELNPHGKAPLNSPTAVYRKGRHYRFNVAAPFRNGTKMTATGWLPDGAGGYINLGHPSATIHD